jgi:hypothetical protein
MAIFNKSARSYLGFETYFLQDNMIIMFEDVVKVIRCQGSERLAVSNIQPKDRAQLSSAAETMKAAFPGGGKTFKDMLHDNEVLFIKADKVQFFNCHGELDDIANLPKVSTCHLAIEIIGMKKNKEDAVSYMMRAYQLKATAAAATPKDCLFK